MFWFLSKDWEFQGSECLICATTNKGVIYYSKQCNLYSQTGPSASPERQDRDPHTHTSGVQCLYALWEFIQSCWWRYTSDGTRKRFLFCDVMLFIQRLYFYRKHTHMGLERRPPRFLFLPMTGVPKCSGLVRGSRSSVWKMKQGYDLLVICTERLKQLWQPSFNHTAAHV